MNSTVSSFNSRSFGLFTVITPSLQPVCRLRQFFADNLVAIAEIVANLSILLRIKVTCERFRTQLQKSRNLMRSKTAIFDAAFKGPLGYRHLIKSTCASFLNY